MYEDCFGFNSRPFIAAPQTKTYFPATIIEHARQTLTRLVARGEGPGLIIGPPGTGKSLLCQLLSEQFQDQFAVALLACGRLKSTQAMLQAVLYELGLPCRGAVEGELRLSLMDYLEPRPEGRAGLLLLVDEAHALGWRLLDELRMLTNLVRDGQPRVRVVLAGGPSLEERFASPKLESFSQRLAGRCYLQPLEAAETAEYVRSQVAAAGGDPATLFDDEALRSVYRASDGVPRLINQVCDHALILASLGGHRRISSETIDEAWADLQQLPPPWTPGATESEASTVVEFGCLDEATEVPEALSVGGAAEQAVEACGPEAQLEAIAEKLADVQTDQAPAMPESTEVELEFPEFGDPFSERFDEEEVVVENYASEVEIFADVPRVSSWEGRQLGSLLQEIDTEAWTALPETTVRLTEPELPLAGQPEPISESTVWTFSPASDPVLPEEPATVEMSPPVEPVSEEEPQLARTGSLDQLSGVANDRDVIVVEDDVALAAHASDATVAAVEARKAEFRQLFAKLRRG